MLTYSDLSAELSDLYPGHADDPAFRRRMLVVEGLPPECTEGLLRTRFTQFGIVTGSHLIRDNVGDEAGVVIFNSDASCSAAAEAEPAPRSYSRVIQATALDMRNHDRSFRHIKNLIGVLYAVSPALVEEDPYFLDRSVLLEGVARITSPLDLLNAFNFQAQAAVLVRDAKFDDRVGLLVLRDAGDCAIALAAPPLQNCYCSCVPASRTHLTRLGILNALDHRARLQANSDLLRSLIPLEYIRADSEMDLHLHCVFLRGPGISVAGGAYGLCRSVGEELPPPARAVIIRRPQNIGVLVYDMAFLTERAWKRASPLRGRGLYMYDSSLFPLPVGAAAGETSLARRLLPPFVTADDYTDRVVLLTGLDTAACDAAMVAQFLETSLHVSNDVEAVIVHGSMKAVIVVLGRTEDAQTLLQEARETWVSAFGEAIHRDLVPTTPIPQLPSVRAAAGVDIHFNWWDKINLMALEHVRLMFTGWLDRCHDDDLRQFTRWLSGLAATSQPRGLRRRYFSDRAVLLTGPALDDTSESRLRAVLSRYGSLDGFILYSRRRVALAIFTSWIAASRLLRQPTLGLMIHCWPAPDAGFAEFIADWVLYRCLDLHGLCPPFG